MFPQQYIERGSNGLGCSNNITGMAATYLNGDKTTLFSRLIECRIDFLGFGLERVMGVWVRVLNGESSRTGGINIREEHWS